LRGRLRLKGMAGKNRGRQLHYGKNSYCFEQVHDHQSNPLAATKRRNTDHVLKLDKYVFIQFLRSWHMA
jgi:hypothetical protein